MATTPEEQLKRLAEQKLGAETPPPTAPPPAPNVEKEAPPTTEEKAAVVASPQTEGDKANQDPVVYQMKINGKDRDLSQKQIEETFGRYRDLNFKNMTNAPINAVADQLMKASGANPDQVAKLISASVKAFTKNAQMGNTRPKQQNVAEPKQPSPKATQPNINEEFAKYEDENAISLPPGYREGLDRINRMENQLKKGVTMMNNILSQSKGNAQMGMQAAQSANVDRNTAIKNTIANNLDKAQQANGLPDGDGQAFMAYAGERGYTMEDFVDSGLVNKVVSDFKNEKNTPEFNRLQDMAKRRESFLKTGKTNPTSEMAAKPKDDMMERLTAKGIKSRLNIG